MTQVITLQDIPRVVPGCTAKMTMKGLSELDNERLLLATRAKDLLGYGGLVSEMTGDMGARSKEGKLTLTLRSMQLEVPDLNRVIDYQMQELVRVTREKISEELSQWTHGYFLEAGWARTDLASYKQPIPEFVLDKALRLKEALPEVRFSVQHLQEP